VSPFLLVMSIGFAVLAVLFTLGAVGALRGRRWLGGMVAGLTAALLFALAALAGTITVGLQGYRALTHEVVAATVHTEPLGAGIGQGDLGENRPRRFRATITLADGTLHMLDLAGDAFYIDAHILKWHPIANIFGLHTLYELDRVSGRYENLSAEQAGPRTVHSLAEAKAVDAFDLAQRFPLLRPLVDAQYGSATFVGARQPATFEVRVSTTGLLVRPVASGR
jgi:hypothetical protein